MAYTDTAEDGCVRIDGDTVLQYRVTRHIHRSAFGIVFKILRSQRNTLIEHDMRTDDSRFADDDSCTVVDAEILTNLCRRMDVNTRAAMRQFR